MNEYFLKGGYLLRFFALIYYTYDLLSYDSFWRMILLEFAWINTILFAFNLIPIPPLDGFTLLELWIKPEKYELINKFRAYGIIIVLILSFAGILGIYLNGVFSILNKASFGLFRAIDALTGLF